jgi:hypothetical protein
LTRRFAAGERRILPFSKLLQSRVHQELRALDRLAELSGSFSLVNDGWSILLAILSENMAGSTAECARIARQRNLCPDLASRYFHALAAERLIVLACPSEDECIAHLADKGLLKVVRYFLPEAVNDG